MRRLVTTEAFQLELTQYINELKTSESKAHDLKEQMREQLKSPTEDQSKEALQDLKIAFEQAKIKHLAVKNALKSAEKVVGSYLPTAKKSAEPTEKKKKIKAEKAEKVQEVEPKAAKKVEMARVEPPKVKSEKSKKSLK
jgi:hypothetical protein